MKIAIGFTGSREGMNKQQKQALLYVLCGIVHLHDEVEGHHGQCIGADEQFAMICKEIGIRTAAHPPTYDRYKSNFVSDITFDPKPFLTRNLDIVTASELLIATPKTREREPRSGTWVTIRYAEEQSKIIFRLLP